MTKEMIHFPSPNLTAEGLRQMKSCIIELSNLSADIISFIYCKKRFQTIERLPICVLYGTFTTLLLNDHAL